MYKPAPAFNDIEEVNSIDLINNTTWTFFRFVQLIKEPSILTMKG